MRSMGFAPQGHVMADGGLANFNSLQGYWRSEADAVREGSKSGTIFSKKIRVSGGVELDVHEFRRIEKFFGTSSRTVEKYRYMLLAYIEWVEKLSVTPPQDFFFPLVLHYKELFRSLY